ncbi:hypothetical protein GCM10010363_61980 [Streptomyces omiyaensis]|nr:hypothetical protein GCM10010363_61980 [Streptomyces omiyaensis]
MVRSWRIGCACASPPKARSTFGGPTTEKNVMKAAEKVKGFTADIMGRSGDQGWIS